MKRNGLFLALLMALALVLTACTPKAQTTQAKPAQDPTLSDTPTPYVRAVLFTDPAKTKSWFKDFVAEASGLNLAAIKDSAPRKAQFLTEAQPDVKTIKQISETFFSVEEVGDYKTADKVKEHRDLEPLLYPTVLEANGGPWKKTTPEERAKEWTDGEWQLALDKLTFERIVISEDNKYAYVAMIGDMRTLHAVGETPGSTYTRRMNLTFISDTSTNNQWRVFAAQFK